MLISDCCGAYAWHFEVEDRLGLCSECLKPATFNEDEEEV